ncbi:hypothetical protein D3C71_2133930 [compost metagenome]
MAFGITGFPGHTHLQRLALLAQLCHGPAHGIIACGFAIEDEEPGSCLHAVLQKGGAA